jgi:choline dehydrogenase-like flavoprotein
MGQLSFSAAGPAGRADAAYGSLFPASGVPASLVLDRMPLTRPAAARLYSYLQPALLLGNGFVSSRYSRNRARLERDADGRARLVVQGGASEDLAPRLEYLERQLGRAFRRLGAWVVPRSFSRMQPGEEVRHSGTIPMRGRPGRGEVDAIGELAGAPGLFIVDLSIFPFMPAKHHTLTLMANADRIGRAIAERWRAVGG